MIHCNLARLSRPLRILRSHARDLDLVPFVTTCCRHDMGPRQRLRFAKSGDPALEEAYSLHFVRPR